MLSSPKAGPAPTGGKEAAPSVRTGSSRAAKKVGGVTVHPVQAGTSGLPGLTATKKSVSPTKAAAGGRLLATSPRSATAKGKLATGYPAALVPLSGSTVATSSLAASGKTVQVALTATSRASGPAILAHYRQVLLARGFSESTAQGVAGATASRFQLGSGASAETVTVTADAPAGGRTSYTVFAVLRTN